MREEKPKRFVYYSPHSYGKSFKVLHDLINAAGFAGKIELLPAEEMAKLTAERDALRVELESVRVERNDFEHKGNLLCNGFGGEMIKHAETKRKYNELLAENKKLRAALEEIAKNSSCMDDITYCSIAEAALK